MEDLQIMEAVPFTDGSFSTDLVDREGNIVATVTRLPDGSAQADVSSSSGFDISGMLRKATGFLEGVAKTAQGLRAEITRVENAVTGAKVGAKAGYSAPTTATPYLVAGGVLVALLVLHEVSSSRRR